MNLDECLPERLRGSLVTPIAAGMSGAGVYRVGEPTQFVLKVAEASTPLEGWRRAVELRRRAAEAGLTPRVVHADEAHRAVVTDFVADKGLMMLLGDPRRRPEAVALLAQMLKRLHQLPPPQGHFNEPREFMLQQWAPMETAAGVPTFVRDAIERVANQTPPPPGPIVLSHNDVNPTNLVFDGAQVMLVDWDVAGPNDALYDLATVAVFFRFSPEECAQLLETHGGFEGVPPRFDYLRRLVSALCGSVMLKLARARGFDDEVAPLTLAEFYQALRTGQLDPRSNRGQWLFGLAMMKQSLAL
ncbi:MAG: phosphotransferase [Myxococcaceae bacterium]